MPPGDWKWGVVALIGLAGMVWLRPHADQEKERRAELQLREDVRNAWDALWPVIKWTVIVLISWRLLKNILGIET